MVAIVAALVLVPVAAASPASPIKVYDPTATLTITPGSSATTCDVRLEYKRLDPAMNGWGFNMYAWTYTDDNHTSGEVGVSASSVTVSRGTASYTWTDVSPSSSWNAPLSAVTRAQSGAYTFNRQWSSNRLLTAQNLAVRNRC